MSGDLTGGVVAVTVGVLGVAGMLGLGEPLLSEAGYAAAGLIGAAFFGMVGVIGAAYIGLLTAREARRREDDAPSPAKGRESDDD